MNPVKVVEKAFDNAQLVIAEYIQAGPRNAEKTPRAAHRYTR
jgi:hypothetical protein